MLPSRNPKFQTFIQPAQTKSEPWRTGLGIVVFVILVVGSFFLFGKTLFVLLENPATMPTITKLSEWVGSSQQGLVLFYFIAAAASLPALWIMLRVVHRRGLNSLISPQTGIIWRHITRAMMFVFAFVALTTLPVIWLGGLEQQLALTVWLVWLLPACFIIFGQILAEELIFRGYLLQQFASHFKSRWIWWVGPSVIFGLLHYNPAEYGANAWLIVGTATLFGMILSDITIRTGNLSAAIGLHFANNLTFVLLVGVPGQTSALSLFLRDLDLQDIPVARLGLLTSAALMLGVYLIYLLVMRQRR